MKTLNNGFFLLVLVLIYVVLLDSGHCIDPLSYNLTSECIMEPPQRSNTVGGFQELKIIEEGKNNTATERVILQKGSIYSITAWIKLKTEEEARVRTTLKGKTVKYVEGGKIMAKKRCWSLLKGGFVVDFSILVNIVFKSDGLETTEIIVKNVRLQQFNKTQWRLQQDQVIEKIRKNKVRFQLKFQNESAMRGSEISIKQIKPSFLLGCAMNYRILESESYKEWFVSRFKLTSFTNEMKWYTTEAARGKENYTLADSMMKIAEDNNVLVKGHTVLWDDRNWQPSWVKKITDREDLRNVTLNRINSIMKRYKGRVIGWDVMNENVHFNYFEDMFGENASAIVYSLASKLDPDVPLFMNEFNTVEYDKEGIGCPINVIKKMEQIVSYPGNINIKGAIGAQAHFVPKQPNLAYMRSALDTLGSMGFPVWLTEVDMPKCLDQVKYMDDILREAYSHPAVEGIIIYAGPEVSGFNKLTLADNDFKNTEAGDLIDKLLQEWQQEPTDVHIQNHEHSDEKGDLIRLSPEISLLHGRYIVTVTNPWVKNFSSSFTVEVTKEMGHLQMVQLAIDA